MKKIKFAVAFLALAFVIVGSAFTTKKATAEVTYGLLATPTQVGTSSQWTYEVVDLNINTTGDCDFSSGNHCKVKIDEQIAGLVVNKSALFDNDRYTFTIDHAVDVPDMAAPTNALFVK